MTYVCSYCKKEFSGFISRKYKFCGKECFVKSGTFSHTIPHSQSSNEKNRLAHIGKHVEKLKGHKFYGGTNGWFKKGQRPWNWQGGVRTLSQIIKDDSRWDKWRKAVFERDNYTCQECGKRGVFLHPHHIKSKVMFPEIAFDLNNGITLCVGCHKMTDNYGGKIKKYDYLHA